MTEYGCRVHIDEPVTWHGKGCRLCAPVQVDEWRPTRRTRGFHYRLTHGEYIEVEEQPHG